VVVLALLLAFALSAAAARADGDPASDYLYVRSLFLPPDVSVSSDQAKALADAVDQAKKAGYEIRVAVIGSQFDLGAITYLWQKPQQYARFLNTELRLVYRGRLLTVMPNGFGFDDTRKREPGSVALVKKLKVGSGSDGMVDSTIAAIAALAKAAGHPVPQLAHVTASSASEKSSGGSSTLVIVLVAVLVAALAVVVGTLYFARRKRASRPSAARE
jgi:hypothetical protein